MAIPNVLSKERYCDYRHKYSHKVGALKVKAIDGNFSIFGLLKKDATSGQTSS